MNPHVKKLLMLILRYVLTFLGGAGAATALDGCRAVGHVDYYQESK